MLPAGAIFRTKLMVVFVVCLIQFGCKNNYKSKIEFTHAQIEVNEYKKFSWPDTSPMIGSHVHIHPVVTEKIKHSILQTLEAKGYQFVLNSTSADFLVSYALSSTNEKTYEPSSILEIENSQCIHPLSKPHNLAQFPDKNDSYAVMTISFFDVNQCMILWQARVKTQFNPHNTELNQNKEINSTVKELLTKFPVKK